MAIPSLSKKYNLFNRSILRRFTACAVIAIAILSYAAALYSQTDWAAKDVETIILPISKPSPLWLYETICDSDAFMSEDCRRTAAQLICQMDSYHAVRLAADKKTIQSDLEAKEWVSKKTVYLPSHMPMCERTLLAALDLQVEMLDCVLREESPQKAAEMSNLRRCVRVIEKSEAFFGDFRDVYVSELTVRLNQISDLQTVLGSTGDTCFDILNNVKSKTQLEAMLLSKICFVARKARGISTGSDDSVSVCPQSAEIDPCW